MRLLSLCVLTMLLLPWVLWAQGDRPVTIERNPKLSMAPDTVGPPYPTISISPGSLPGTARIRLISSLFPQVDYLFFYRGTHPYFIASSAVLVWRDTLRTIPATTLEIIDSSSGIGDPSRNFCYVMREVDAVDPADTSTWRFSAPSNIVCDWDFSLVSPPGLTHWNQITIPFWDYGFDTLAGWGERIAGISEIDQWEPTTQTFALRALKSGGVWTSGRNRRTKFGVPYHITGAAIGGVASFWGDRRPDSCTAIFSNDTLTDLNNIALQPAWHWFMVDSSINFHDFGMKLYDGTTMYDYGVREILEWAPTTQSWLSRSMWNGTTWTSRPGVKVYGCYMLRRPYNTVPGGGTGTPCWPPLVR